MKAIFYKGIDFNLKLSAEVRAQCDDILAKMRGMKKLAEKYMGKELFRQKN